MHKIGIVVTAVGLLAGCASTGASRWTGDVSTGDFWVGCIAAAEIEASRLRSAGASQAEVEAAMAIRMASSFRRNAYRPDLTDAELASQVVQARGDLASGDAAAAFAACRHQVTIGA